MFAQTFSSKKGLATSAAAIAAAGNAAMADDDFEGAYFGLTAPVWAGGENGDGSTSADYDISDTEAGLGVFFGYNQLFGAENNWLYGGEVAFDPSTYKSDDYELSNSLTAKLKLGRVFGSGEGSFGKTLLYGFLSYGTTEFGFADGPNYSSNRGAGVGIGVETKITDNISVGLEYHDQSLDYRNEYSYNYGTASPRTISFRTLVRF